MFIFLYRASFAAGIAAVRRERRQRKRNEMAKDDIYDLEEIINIMIMMKITIYNYNVENIMLLKEMRSVKL